jgi:hypothetical protein
MLIHDRQLECITVDKCTLEDANNVSVPRVIIHYLSLSHSQLQSSSITMIVREAMKYDPPHVAKFTPGPGLVLGVTTDRSKT